MKKRLCRIAAVLMALCMALTVSGPMKNVQAAGNGNMTIIACQINADQTTVSVIAASELAPASDDGLLYLFAEPTYSTGITTAPIASSPAAPTVGYTVELLQGQATSRLYSKFVVAAVRGGQFVPVSNFCHIINPEAIAKHTAARIQTTSIKGLTPTPDDIHFARLVETGTQHLQYNVMLGNLLGTSTHPNYPTIVYTYNGKDYLLNGHVVAEYDYIFGFAKQHNIAVTAVCLNNLKPGYEVMVNPYARGSSYVPYYYMPNASEPAGVEYIAALYSFLAARYSGGQYGQVDNWVIGNEVSAAGEWNYAGGKLPLETFVDEYAKGFRVAYNAIKSENALAEVYTCIDQVWARRNVESGRYRSRDFLQVFNANISSQGNIDWGVVNHPYAVPLTYCPWWTGRQGAYYLNLVKHNADSPFVTMENLEVFTDYMCRPEMLSPQGDVRSIILAEIGFCAAQGEDNQAIAFAWSYMQAEANQYVDAFIVHRQSDDPFEIQQKLWLGIEDLNGTPRMIYDFYKNMDTPNSMPYRQMALQVVGRDIIPR